MKRYQLKIVVFLMGMALLAGCGKKEAEAAPENVIEIEAAPEVNTDAGDTNTNADSAADNELTESTETTVMDRNLDEIKTYLSGFPSELSELETSKSYVVMHDEEQSGREYLDAFLEAVDAGTPAELVIVQYSVEGAPLLYYLNYDGNDFYAVYDYSRDTFIGDGEKYEEMTYPYLNLVDGTAENGDRFRYIVLSDKEELTMEDIESYWTKESADGEKIYFISYIVTGNEYAETDGTESWHDTETSYDEDEVLIDDDQIAKISVINGATGEEKSFTAGKEFEELCDLYEDMDFSINPDLPGRSGYTYRMVLYGADGMMLQSITPYKDAVSIDGNIYDASMNGTAVELLLKLKSLW